MIGMVMPPKSPALAASAVETSDRVVAVIWVSSSIMLGEAALTGAFRGAARRGQNRPSHQVAAVRVWHAGK